MTERIEPAATALADTLRTLERTLDQARGHWGDAARQTFDQRHAAPIVLEGGRSAAELSQLAQEIDAASRVVDGLG